MLLCRARLKFQQRLLLEAAATEPCRNKEGKQQHRTQSATCDQSYTALQQQHHQAPYCTTNSEGASSYTQLRALIRPMVWLLPPHCCTVQNEWWPTPLASSDGPHLLCAAIASAILPVCVVCRW
jgi:hypothetical protein